MRANYQSDTDQFVETEPILELLVMSEAPWPPRPFVNLNFTVGRTQQRTHIYIRLSEIRGGTAIR